MCWHPSRRLGSWPATIRLHHTDKETIMLKLSIRYTRYVLAALATVGSLNGRGPLRRAGALWRKGPVMLETAFAQLRFVASVAFGLPFSARSLDRLVDGLLATRREFGAIGVEGAELLGGPALDEETR